MLTFLGVANSLHTSTCHICNTVLALIALSQQSVTVVLFFLDLNIAVKIKITDVCENNMQS